MAGPTGSVENRGAPSLVDFQGESANAFAHIWIIVGVAIDAEDVLREMNGKAGAGGDLPP